METIVHNVGELGESGRSAAETLVGHALVASQQLVIQIVDRDLPPSGNQPTGGADELPDWCNVYAGLCDDQVAKLKQAISRRLDLKRSGT